MAKYLYKSKNFLVYIDNSMPNSRPKREIVIKYRKPYGMFLNKFKWDYCAVIYSNHQMSTKFCRGYRYQMMNMKELHGEPHFFNDLRQLNKIIGEEIFNDESILKYETYMVAERLKNSK